jgi:hypothetical protein
MDIYSKRRRARRLNDPNKTVEKETDDEVDPDDLELDYGGVVEKANDEEEARERREEFAKSVGDSGGGIDWEEVWKGDREEDPDIELDYSGVLKDDDEHEREKDAKAIGEAVAEELERRGVTPEADADANEETEADEDSGGGAVEKAGERTADLLADMQDDLRDLKRLRSVRNIAKSYVADGGDPEDTMDEVFEWVDDHSEENITVEKDGSVTVEDAAT